MAKDLFNNNDLIILGIIVFLIIILYFNKQENMDASNNIISNNEEIPIEEIPKEITESDITTSIPTFIAIKPAETQKIPKFEKSLIETQNNENFKLRVCNMCTPMNPKQNSINYEEKYRTLKDEIIQLNNTNKNLIDTAKRFCKSGVEKGKPNKPYTVTKTENSITWSVGKKDNVSEEYSFSYNI